LICQTAEMSDEALAPALACGLEGLVSGSALCESVLKRRIPNIQMLRREVVPGAGVTQPSWRERGVAL